MYRPVPCLIVFLIAVLDAHAAEFAIDLPGTSIPVQCPGSPAGATLTVSGASGVLVQRALAPTDGGHFKLPEAGTLGSGQYRYRVDFAETHQTTRAGNGSDGRAAATPAASAFAPVEGSFRIDNGQLFVRGMTNTSEPETARASAAISGGITPNDVVTPDDEIIQGQLCVGFDCVVNESFGFDTIMLKENNTRIHFNDTSTGVGFPNTNWQLTANDSGSGGLNKFSIEDLTAATVPFTVLGGAPTNSIYVASNGKVGFRTSTPALDLHLYTSDTPAIRLEQSNAGGFTPQAWDIGGNEANFFVRDLTGGSRLPFRIRPGAPTSSIDIAASGYVGIGTASPAANLDIHTSVDLSTPANVLRVMNTGTGVDPAQQDRFTIDSAGNVLARGTISQLSSRFAKENFQDTNGRVLLAKLEQMPISSWNYRGAPAQERHLGPVAEDFHAAFGLGASERFVSVTDEAGVALASVKALQQEIKQRDERIEALEQRLQALEARLDQTSR
jgi:hypothetical protein